MALFKSRRGGDEPVAPPAPTESVEVIRRRARHRLIGRCAAVLLSPVHGVLPPKDLAEWILQDRVPVRLQLQAHKYIWTPETRGV